jgi:hypothetical protein
LRSRQRQSLEQVIKIDDEEANRGSETALLMAVLVDSNAKLASR